MIEKKDIEKLAKLARIKVTDAEIESFQKEIDPILGYVSELSAIELRAKNTPEKEELSVYNVLREDGAPHEGGAYTEAILTQAPGREGNFLKVKKIL